MAKLRYSKNSLCGRRSLGDYLIISPLSFHILQTNIQDHHKESADSWGYTSTLHDSCCYRHHHRDKLARCDVRCHLHSTLLVHTHHMITERSLEVSVACDLWLVCYSVFAHMLCRVHGMGRLQTFQRNTGRSCTMCIYSRLHLESVDWTQYCQLPECWIACLRNEPGLYSIFCGLWNYWFVLSSECALDHILLKLFELSGNASWELWETKREVSSEIVQGVLKEDCREVENQGVQSIDLVNAGNGVTNTVSSC